MKKILLSVVAIIIIAVIYFAADILSNLNSIIKAQIEKQGSHYLQTTVSVDSVDFKLLDGLGQINGLKISNPAGFKDANAMAFQQFKLNIDTATVTKAPIVIQELLIDAPEVVYEVDATGKGNLQALLDNLNKQLPKSDTKANEEATAQSKDSPLVSINKVTVANVKLSLDLQALGLKDYAMTLPTFQADPIGVPDGVPADQAGKLIAKSMLKNLIDAAKKHQKDKLKDKVKDEAGKKLRDLLNKNGG